MTDEQRTQMIYEIHQEREAYDNAVGLVSIAQILEIIDEVYAMWSDNEIDTVGEAIAALNDMVLSLIGEEE